MDCEVHCPDHLQEKQIYHVNLLWEWQEPERWAAFTDADAEDLGPQGVSKEKETAKAESQICIGEELSMPQRQEVPKLVKEFWNVFREEPS